MSSPRSSAVVVAALAIVAVIAACTPSARPCRDDAQCEAGQSCDLSDADDEVGTCVAADGDGEGEGEGEPGGDEGEGEGEGGEGEGEGRTSVSARSVFVGGVFACAIDAEARVQCWGGNSVGQLGRITDRFDRDDVAAPIPGLTDVVDVALGEFHACAIGRLDGGQQRVWCWGDPSQGSLGVDGNVEVGELVEPELPAGVGTEIIDVAADGDNNGGLTCGTDGTAVYCWGVHAPDTVNGQPVRVNGLGSNQTGLLVSIDGICASSGTQAVTCVEVGAGLALLGCSEGARCPALDNGARHDSATSNACIIVDGTASCAGDNTFGVVDPSSRGPDTRPLTPILVATSIAVGTQHACAVSGLAVKCWGRPLFGATGLLETDTFDTEPCAGNPAVRCHGVIDVPMPAGILGFVDVVTHRTHSCATSADGRVVCWGNADPADEETARPRAVPLFR